MLVEESGLLATRLVDGRLARLLLRLVPVFIGALLAQVKLFELFLAEDLRDVQDGLVMAFLALHCRPIPALLPQAACPAPF